MTEKFEIKTKGVDANPDREITQAEIDKNLSIANGSLELTDEEMLKIEVKDISDAEYLISSEEITKKLKKGRVPAAQRHIDEIFNSKDEMQK